MGRQAVLITGATGFVGAHLTKYLVDAGYIVHAIVRPVSDISGLKALKQEQLRIHIYDSQHHFKEIFEEISEREKPRLVYHLASMVVGAPAVERIGELIQSNITFGVDLLEAMKAYGIRNLVNTGTSWQHYENALYNPVNLYAATKQAFQDIEVYYEQACGFKVINLHLFDNYGPGDKRKKLLNLLKDAGERGTVLQMTPGEQLIDLVYIDDLVRAFVLAGEYLLQQQYDYCGTYAVSSGRPIALRNLVEVIQKIMSKEINIKWGGAAI